MMNWVTAVACSLMVAGIPPWRTQLMPWEWHAGLPSPWRSDPRFAGRFAPGYDDDLQVVFLNPDSAAGKKHEVMWVRVTAYDSASDEYLGILLNQPDFFPTLLDRENVVFHYDSTRRYAVAVAVAGRYEAAGWPTSAVPAFFGRLREGIRAYRSGDNGHNMPGIDRCVSVLAPAMRDVPAGARSDERFVGHYVLGRCLSEQYKTEAALDQFRAALGVDSADCDAHMAALAELSVLTHRRPDLVSSADSGRWDNAFVAELSAIRARCTDRPGVQQTLDLIFNPAQEAQLAPVWRSSIPRLRRVGYAFFRWKQR